MSQRENAAGLGALSLTDFYVARYRLDSMLNTTLVLRDSAVLDGRFHLSLKPEELLSKLGRTDPVPLVIRSRASDLSDGLLRFWVGEGPTLQRFALSTIPDYAVRKQAEDVLAETPRTFVKRPSDILHILRGAVPSETVDLLEEGWGRWLAAAAAGKIVVEPWGTGGLPIRDAFAVEPLGDALALLQTEDARDLAKELHARFLDIQDGTVSQNRSVVDDVIEERLRDASQDVRPEILAVRAWLYRAYNRASATRYDCNFETVEDATLPPISALRRVLHKVIRSSGRRSSALPKDHGIPLPDEFLQRLAVMPDELFRWFMVKQRTRLERWWAEGDAAALRATVEAICTEVDWPADATVKDKVIKVGVRTASYSLPPAGGFLAGLADVTAAPAGVIAGRAAADVIEFVLRSQSSKARTACRVVEYGSRRTQPPRRKGR